MYAIFSQRKNTIYTVVLLLLFWISVARSIDCFKCVSMSGRFPPCDDPFHNNHSLDLLESPCMGGRKGRDGLFPATSCIKIAGYFGDTGESITVRGCGLDSGTVTTDTEIIRMSHCGRFYYNDRSSECEWTSCLYSLYPGANPMKQSEVLRAGLNVWFPVVPIDGARCFRYVHGCLQSCNDADACNSSNKQTPYLPIISLLLYHFISYAVALAR